MANVVLKVTLNQTSGYLEVDEVGNPNRIPHGVNDTLTWELSGDAASGTFNAINAGVPGFEWIQDPPNGVFGAPGVEANGNKLKITDNNTDPNGINSTGEWVYQLGATINGTPYTTNTTDPAGNPSDPTIHNM